MIVSPSRKGGPDYRQATPPASPHVGCVWYDTSTHALKIWNGNDWDVMAQFDPPGAHYGYTPCGRSSTATGFTSVVERVTFPFDVGVANIVGYNTVESEGNACQNSSLHGYFHQAQVYQNNYTSAVQRFPFPFGAGYTVHRLDTAYPLNGPTGANSSLHGYIHESAARDPEQHYSPRIERFSFAGDYGVCALTGTLPYVQAYGAAFTDGQHGYFVGGQDLVDGTYISRSTVSRIGYPFDSGTADVAGYLSLELRCLLNGCNSTAYGYVAGGVNNDGEFQARIRRVAFSTGGESYSSVYLDYACCWPGTFNSTTHGFVSSGWFSDGSVRTMLSRFDFAVDEGLAAVVGYLVFGHSEGAGLDGVDYVTQFV